MNLLLDPIIKQKMVDLGITVPNDTVLDVIWDYLCSLVGYDLSEHQTVETQLGNGTNRIFVEKYPMTSIDGVRINDEDEPLSDFRIVEHTAVEYIDGCFDYGRKGCASSMRYYSPIIYGKMKDKVEITYTSGYTAATFPNDLLLAVMSLLATIPMYKLPSGLTSYKISDIEYKFSATSSIDPKLEDLLSKYR